MTEEELRAICKGCRERYPDGDFRGCPNYADVELVQHEQSQADRIAKLEDELERAKRERDAAVKDLKHGDNCDICKWADTIPECTFECDECTLNCTCRTCRDESNWQWRGVKDGG